jgi:hypothetical protein
LEEHSKRPELACSAPRRRRQQIRPPLEDCSVVRQAINQVNKLARLAAAGYLAARHKPSSSLNQQVEDYLAALLHRRNSSNRSRQVVAFLVQQPRPTHSLQLQEVVSLDSHRRSHRGACCKLNHVIVS